MKQVKTGLTQANTTECEASHSRGTGVGRPCRPRAPSSRDTRCEQKGCRPWQHTPGSGPSASVDKGAGGRTSSSPRQLGRRPPRLARPRPSHAPSSSRCCSQARSSAPWRPCRAAFSSLLWFELANSSSGTKDPKHKTSCKQSRGVYKSRVPNLTDCLSMRPSLPNRAGGLRARELRRGRLSPAVTASTGASSPQPSSNSDGTHEHPALETFHQGFLPTRAKDELPARQRK